MLQPCNRLTAIDNLESLRYMKVLDLSGNKIRSLRGLENNEFLENADLEDNEVRDTVELLQRNPMLTSSFRISLHFMCITRSLTYMRSFTSHLWVNCEN